METLQHLIAHAAALGGADMCADGHDWQDDGGRACPTGNDQCGQPVFRCSRCGVHDYGDDPEGPGMIECRSCCGDSMLGWRSDWMDETPNAGIEATSRPYRDGRLE